jgi:hypothetical protein
MIATTLLPALAFTPQLAAQDNQDHHQRHHHYKLIDLGTLGGPQSFSFFGDAQSLNNREMAVGQADTSAPDPNYPNFNPYLGSGSPDPFIEHAFKWQNAALTDLGALPGVNSSTVEQRRRGGWDFLYQLDSESQRRPHHRPIPLEERQNAGPRQLRRHPWWS